MLDVRKDTADSLTPIFPPTTFDLSTVTSVSETDLHRISFTSALKSFELDPLPMSLLQEFVLCPSSTHHRPL